MKKLNIFIELTRLNKPIGFMLLFWPCSWGLTLAYYSNGETTLYFKYLVLFLFGSILMRSAGCIFNDIVDKDLDKKVKRTKKRPIASNKISVINAFAYVILLCLIALSILLQFNYFTIMLGMGSMILAFAYPYMKRITYWPQLFLGLTFNWGVIMGYAAITNSISTESIILYIAAIFWTLGYDTIYGLQDMHDDEIIGVKSTSIKFKNNVKVFVGTCYSLFIIGVLMLGILMKIDMYVLFLIIFLILSVIHQVKTFRSNNAESCLLSFKMNNLTGLLTLIFIFCFNI